MARGVTDNLVRRVMAFVLGLALPLTLAVGVIHLAAERAAAAHLHVERVEGPVPHAYTVALDELGALPEAFATALHVAAREGGADVPFRGDVRTAWDQLAARVGEDQRIVILVEGVGVLVEPRVRDAVLEAAAEIRSAMNEGLTALGRRLAG